MTTQLALYERTLTLHRFPVIDNDPLQAWNAGDEYLINHMASFTIDEDSHILILNDNFGALSCWFSPLCKVTTMSDSYVSHQAIKNNLSNNHCPEITLLSTLDELPADVDVVLMQIPHNARHLKWQLTALRQALPAHCQIIAVDKAQDIRTATLNTFTHYLGQTTTSLAWKKHRLVFSIPDSKNLASMPAPLVWSVPEHDLTISNLANVFSAESLDIGARFMLDHLPQDNNLESILDLGCGNGVLSVKLAKLNPQAEITSVDESYMAVASAHTNLCELNNLADSKRFNLVTNNCLDGFDANQFDLVVCNPPFHQQKTITDHIAWQMCQDAKRVLKVGGKLLLIGNRHLRYDIKLAKLFKKSHVTTVAANNKFVILQATKS